MAGFTRFCMEWALYFWLLDFPFLFWVVTLWMSAKRREKIMTWSEIKKAVEQAGVQENEEIGIIQCENHDGDHTFHKVRLGKVLKLAENV